MADAIGDIDLALDRIEDALLAAAPQRLRRPFLDVGTDLERLLAARVERGSEVAPFAVDLAHRMRGQEPRPAAAVLVEPLTTREQVVLRYLASALSNAEIAAELYVSVNTVKTHQRTVYRKLAARGPARRRAPRPRAAAALTARYPEMSSAQEEPGSSSSTRSSAFTGRRTEAT